MEEKRNNFVDLSQEEYLHQDDPYMVQLLKELNKDRAKSRSFISVMLF